MQLASIIKNTAANGDSDVSNLFLVRWRGAVHAGEPCMIPLLLCFPLGYKGTLFQGVITMQ